VIGFARDEEKALMNPADLLSSSSRQLVGEQRRVWTQAVSTAREN